MSLKHFDKQVPRFRSWRRDQFFVTGRRAPLFPWLLLGVLALACLCSMLDRIVISLLVEPIKADLGLSDTQISLLQGMAFVMVYAVAGMPMGMLVDRVTRTPLTAAGVALWSLMTILCGVSNNFTMLFLARAGVGIGEATLTPAGYSLISDAFEKRRLGIALGIFTMAGAIGTGLSLVVGGVAVGALAKYGDTALPLLGVLKPWQLTFIVLAIPGLFIAFLVAAMPNPPRGAVSGAAVGSRAIVPKDFDRRMPPTWSDAGMNEG